MIDVPDAVSILKAGGIVALPTETVYGLAAKFSDQNAVLKVFEAKQRPSFNPLIVHVANPEMLERIVAKIPEKAALLMDAFWPGPISFLLPKKTSVSDIVTAGSDHVVVRMPGHNIFLKVIAAVGEPLVAPSANTFCKISPTKAEHVEKQLGDKIDGVVDGGSCLVGVESTIVGFADDAVQVLREGGVTRGEIEDVLKCKLDVGKQQSGQTPGSLKKHYAPDIPLTIVEDSEWQSTVDVPTGFITLSPVNIENRKVLNFPLSTDGNLSEAAKNVYQVLHNVSEANLTKAYVQLVPNEGLGYAINDRLTRAAASGS